MLKIKKNGKHINAIINKLFKPVYLTAISVNNKIIKLNTNTLIFCNDFLFFLINKKQHIKEITGI